MALAEELERYPVSSFRSKMNRYGCANVGLKGTLKESELRCGGPEASSSRPGSEALRSGLGGF
mgnify:CR=1 FL=1